MGRKSNKVKTSRRAELAVLRKAEKAGVLSPQGVRRLRFLKRVRGL